MKNKPAFLVLAGDGINCEQETAHAFRLVDADAVIVHINDLLASPDRLDDFDGLALPGGFSFGDELGSGRILALKIKYGLFKEFQRFLQARKPVIGICNGFQTLLMLGLLPEFSGTRTAALVENECGYFRNIWTGLRANDSVCVWTRNLPAVIELPVRHGEGRLVFASGSEAAVYRHLLTNGQIPLQYVGDVNGSYQNIAALCDPSGLILGMMPHPEAFVYQATARKKTASALTPGIGRKLFANIVEYLKSGTTEGMNG